MKTLIKKKLLLSSVALATLFSAANVMAVPFSSPDPRSFAMGGTGVASGSSANASFVNPALLAAARDDEDFSLEFPIFAVSAADPDDLGDALDTLDTNDSFAAFDLALINYNAAVNAALPDYNAVLAANAGLVTATQNMSSDLANISNKALQLNGSVATAVGIPSKKFGISLFVNAWGAGGGFAEYTAADQSTVDGITSDLSTTITNLQALNPSGVPINTLPPATQALIAAELLAAQVDPTTVDTMTSNFQARFAALAEVGISFARQVNVGGYDVAVGLTPKFVKVRTYDYIFSGSTLDTAEVTLDSGEATESNFNLDVGLAKDFDNGWKTGLTVKNLMTQDYVTVLGNTIKVEPQARLGVSHQTDWTLVAVDVDLTENEPAGFESKSQYVGLGAELDVFDSAQLRLGYRANLSDSDSDVATAGIGLSPFGVHLDLGVAAGSNEVGVSMQLGFRF